MSELSERITYLFPLIQDRQCSDPRQSNSHLFRTTRNNLHFKASAQSETERSLELLMKFQTVSQET